MPTKVQSPDGRIIQFPDSMSRDDINGAMQRMYPPKSSAPEAFSIPGMMAGPGINLPQTAAEDQASRPGLWDALKSLPIVPSMGIPGHAGRIPSATTGGALGAEGYPTMAEGAKEMLYPERYQPQAKGRARAGGAAKVIGGAMEAATPLMVAGGLASPVSATKAIGGSMLAGYATRKGIETWNNNVPKSHQISPEVTSLVDQLAQLSGAAVGAGPEAVKAWRGKLTGAIAGDLAKTGKLPVNQIEAVAAQKVAAFENTGDINHLHVGDVAAPAAPGSNLDVTLQKAGMAAKATAEAALNPLKAHEKSEEKKPAGPTEYEQLKARVEAAEKQNLLRKEPVVRTEPPLSPIPQPDVRTEPAKTQVPAAPEVRTEPAKPVIPTPETPTTRPMWDKAHMEVGESRPPIEPTVHQRLEQMKSEAGWAYRFGSTEPTPEPQAAGPETKLSAKQKAMQARVAQEKAELAQTFPSGRSVEEVMARAKATAVPKAPEVGQPEQAAPSPIPGAEPVPPAIEAPGSREPIRPAERPEVAGAEPRSREEFERLRTREGTDNPAAIQARMDAIARAPKETGMRDWAKYPDPRLAKIENLSVSEKDLAKNLGLGPQSGRMDVYDALVRNYMKKGMAKGTAELKAREKMKNARGSLDLGGPEDVNKRREAKIKLWIDMVRNPATRPEVLDRVIKNLQSYGLSHDDIIKRVAGASEFAKTGQETSQESLEERTAGYPKPGEKESEGIIDNLTGMVDKTLEGYPKPGERELTSEEKERMIQDAKKEISSDFGLKVNFRQNLEIFLDAIANDDVHAWGQRFTLRDFRGMDQAKRQTLFEEYTGDKLSSEGALKGFSTNDIEGFALRAEARIEGSRKGASDIRGVKSPDIEELERMLARPDNRPEDSARIKAYLEQKVLETEALVEGRAVGRPDIKGVKIDKGPGLGPRGQMRRPPKGPEAGFLYLGGQNPFTRLANAIDRVLPDKPETQAAAENIIRDKAAQLARKELMAEAKFKDAVAAHDNDGKTEFRAFMDAGEGKQGAQFLNPTDQALATELHSMFQERWAKVVQIKGFENEDGIDNYLSHLWESPRNAKGILPSLYAKRPLEGKAGFLRQRVYDYASEGLDHGLKPITYNPIRMQMAALHQLDKYIMAHEIKDMYKDAGLVQWHSLEQWKDRPTGWQKLDDKIFQPKKMEGGALSEYGTYFAPPEVAKVFNRYLQPGLRGSPTYEAVRGYSNILNQAQLGLSAYHGTFITIMSGISDVALGLEKVINNRDMRGFKDILRGSLGTFIARSATRDYVLGRSIQEEALSPGVHPELQPLVRGIEAMGGRFEQDPMYANRQSRSALAALRDRKYREFLSTGIQKINPIMTKWVPRIKLGMAARLMEAKMEYLDKQGIHDPMTTRNELAKVWDSVDNRAGQMVYDNLFWNKTAKDLAFLSVRAVGWDYGSGREFFGGLKDVAKQSAKLMRGEKAQLTSRMAFTIATPVVVGMLGAMTHYLATGKAPQKPEDYFYPATGKVHPDGTPERLSWPSYMKDFYAFKQAPIHTLINKLHPSIQEATQLYENADFYGTEIRSPGDPLYKQGLQVLKFMGKNFTPFGIQGMERRHESGEPWATAGTAFFGVMPAPTYIGQTKAEELSFELSKRKWQAGPKDSKQAEIHQNFLKLQREMDSHTLTSDELTAAQHAGKITFNEVNRLFDQNKMTRLERNFTDLSLPEAIKVYSVATPEERAQLKLQFIDKLSQLPNLPEPDQKAYQEKFKALMQ